MKYIKLILAIIIFSIVITSCSKKNKTGKMIPKEAIVVADINAKSLSSKLTFDEIKQSYWYQQLMSDSNHSGEGKAFLEDPSKTGIDLKSNLIFFLLKENTGKSFVIEGTLKDNKKFTAFIKAMHPGAATTKDGDLNVFTSGKAVIGWNDDRFVLVSSVPDNLMQSALDKDSSAKDSALHVVPAKQISPDSMVAVCKNIFALKEDNSLYSNEKFSDLLSEDGDAHFWINTNELYKSSLQNLPGAFGMVKLDKFLEDNYATATVSFDDGKITSKNKWYAGKELSDILKSGSGNINTDMIKKSTSPNTAAVFSMHFNPENLLGILRLTGLDGFINLALAQKGLSLEDIGKATKGDMFFSLSDVTVKNDSLKMQNKNGKDPGKNLSLKADGTFLLSVSVNDKDVFNKISNIAKMVGGNLIQTPVFSRTDDKYFAVSNQQNAVNNYFSGTTSNPPFLDKIKDHSVIDYVDLQMLLKSMQAGVTADSTANIIHQKNLSMWNNIYLTGGEYKDGGLVFNSEVNLIDKSTNSLKQLNKFLDEMSRLSAAQKKMNMQSRNNSARLNSSVSDSLHKNKPHR